jgi:hypothetical protein
MPDSIIPQLEGNVIEDSNSTKEERNEKEFRKEEEENDEKENEQEDNSEDTEIEEEFLEYAPNLSATITYFKKRDFTQKNLLNSYSNTSSKYLFQNYPPFYILFACLKIDC